MIYDIWQDKIKSFTLEDPNEANLIDLQLHSRQNKDQLSDAILYHSIVLITWTYIHI